MLSSPHNKQYIYSTMATASHISLLFLALVALTPSTTSAAAASPNLNLLNLQEVFQLFGFPLGLIPAPVDSFTLTPIGILPPTFNFTIHYKEPCYVQFVYPNYYNPVFTGKITFGKLFDMQGHKDQFPSGEWINMYDVTVVDQNLYFQFATASATVDRSFFAEVKNCTYGPLLPADYSNQLISQLPISAE
ncbi:hypothetical protein Hdeb2414_s0844g00953191 [Helianthus debilis subsp. tardiflorus]